MKQEIKHELSEYLISSDCLTTEPQPQGSCGWGSGVYRGTKGSNPCQEEIPGRDYLLLDEDLATESEVFRRKTASEAKPQMDSGAYDKRQKEFLEERNRQLRKKINILRKTSAAERRKLRKKIKISRKASVAKGRKLRKKIKVPKKTSAAKGRKLRKKIKISRKTSAAKRRKLQKKIRISKKASAAREEYPSNILIFILPIVC